MIGKATILLVAATLLTSPSFSEDREWTCQTNSKPKTEVKLSIRDPYGDAVKIKPTASVEIDGDSLSATYRSSNAMKFWFLGGSEAFILKPDNEAIYIVSDFASVEEVYVLLHKWRGINILSRFKCKESYDRKTKTR